MTTLTEHCEVNIPASVVAGPCEFEFTFFSLRRSGHHAVMVWLANHFPLPVVVLNDVKPYRDPFLTSKFPNDWDKHSPWLRSLSGTIETVRSAAKPCLMLSYQDLDISAISMPQIVPNRCQAIGEARTRYTLLVLRDPFNLLASRRAKPVPLSTYPEPASLLDMWEAYALEYLGETCHLGKLVRVNYTRWVKHQEYRRRLSESIGLQFTDRGREIVPRAGDGSSFDLVMFDGRASQMKVMERWKYYANDIWFQNAFRHRERLVSLYRRIFPRDDALDSFLRRLKL